MIGVRFARVLAFVLCISGTLHATMVEAAVVAKFSDPLGFSFTYPGDWETLPLPPAFTAPDRQLAAKSEPDITKRATLCTDPVLAVGDRRTASALFILTISYACLGIELDQASIKGFGAGVLHGLEGPLNLTSSVGSTYTSGTHQLWAGLAHGSSKALPDNHFTAEAACAILLRGVACWLERKPSDDGLDVLASGLVTLDNDPPTVLVPANAFDAAESGA